MIQKLKQFVVAVAGTMALAALVPAVAHAQINLDNNSPDISSGLCAGTDFNPSASPRGGCSSASKATDANTQMQSLIQLVINVFSLVVGVVSVLMIIVGGFRYITSGGASDSITAAKNTIIYAIIGLVIVALAQFIVHFVLGRVAAAQ